MASVSSIRLKCEPIRSLAFGSILATYAGIGTNLTKPIRMFILQNFTDIALVFSLDGIDDHIVLTANGQLILDVSSNKTMTQGFYLGEGSRVYVKRLTGAPTTGGVYLSTFYGAE